MIWCCDSVIWQKCCIERLDSRRNNCPAWDDKDNVQHKKIMSCANHPSNSLFTFHVHCMKLCLKWGDNEPVITTTKVALICITHLHYHAVCHFLFQCWLLLCLAQTLLCKAACSLTWNQTPTFCLDNNIHLSIANICHVAYRTFASMISFPGGRGYITRTLSQSSFNQGSTVASGLWKRKYRNKQTIMAN